MLGDENTKTTFNDSVNGGTKLNVGNPIPLFIILILFYRACYNVTH